MLFSLISMLQGHASLWCSPVVRYTTLVLVHTNWSLTNNLCTHAHAHAHACALANTNIIIIFSFINSQDLMIPIAKCQTNRHISLKLPRNKVKLPITSRMPGSISASVIVPAKNLISFAQCILASYALGGKATQSIGRKHQCKAVGTSSLVLRLYRLGFGNLRHREASSLSG